MQILPSTEKYVTKFEILISLSVKGQQNKQFLMGISIHLLCALVCYWKHQNKIYHVSNLPIINMIKYKYSGKSNLGNWHRYKIYLSIMISFWHFTAMIKPTTVAVAAWILDTHLQKKKWFLYLPISNKYIYRH